MTWKRKIRLTYVSAAKATAIVGVMCTVGCVTGPHLRTRAERYRLEVELDPETHSISGRAVLELVRAGQEALPEDGPVVVELLLHPGLKITRATASGATIRRRARVDVVRSDEGEVTARKHAIVLDGPVEAFTLFIEYSGELFENVAAGEVPGQIHNFDVDAHIGTEGIYLGGAYWYPEPAADDDAEPALTDYTLIVDPLPGVELVAGAERDPVLSEQTGRLAWRNSYRLDGMVLVGGPHEVHRGTYNDIAIDVHLKPSQAQHAAGLIDTVKRNLERYEPLIGPYPAREYSIVDNFFSSGFAFPTMTLLSSAVIDMGHRAQIGHGYIDHEMLHCWWGNGIHVDPRDGNWCEALASYGANYYGYILDGEEDQARRQRRNYSHFLSRIKPENDKPLGTYGLEDGCGRSIAYSKGAAVFHMLARRMGQDNFWSAMRRFTAEYVGKHASWHDIRSICEKESGLDLATFFEQWVRRGGAPSITVDHATYSSSDNTITITLSQDEPTFELDVPIRITHANGTDDVVVPLSTLSGEVTVPVNGIPTTVELDPDYHLFRKIPIDQIVPTTSATRRGNAFACVLPAGDVHEQYAMMQSIFESSFEDDERIAVVAGDIEDGALAEKCVLVLGSAAHDPYVSAFLSAIEFPLQWTDGGFKVDGVEYTDAGDAVLCTARHPGVSGGGVTVVYANSDAAIPSGRIIPMYSHSLVIFRDGRRVHRRDFEPRSVTEVRGP